MDLGRHRLVRRDKVVLRQPHLLPLVHCRDVVCPVLLHLDRAAIHVTLARHHLQLLPAIERQHPVLQRTVHLHLDLRLRPLNRAQVAAMLLRHLLQTCPARIVIRHLDLLHRRQVHHPHLVVLRRDRPRLHVSTPRSPADPKTQTDSLSYSKHLQTLAAHRPTPSQPASKPAPSQHSYPDPRRHTSRTGAPCPSSARLPLL